MAILPPPIGEQEFQAVTSIDPDSIYKSFEPFMEQLHAFLNQLPCLADIQQVRGGRSKRAFLKYVCYEQHWFTYNRGGRNEAQFNLGLFPDYLRIGIGFEPTNAKWGNPDMVWEAYRRFVAAIKEKREEFQKLAEANQLEIEWDAGKDQACHHVPTDRVFDWLLEPPDAPWLFLGRLLRRDAAATILENPHQLGAVIYSVFSGLRPYWECALPRRRN